MIRRERRHGHRFVRVVETIDRQSVDQNQARDLCEHIDPTGEGSLQPYMRARQKFRETPGGGVLAHIIDLKTSSDDRLYASARQCGLMLDRHPLSLLQDERALADRVSDDRAHRLGDWNRSKFHAAFSSARSGFLRSAPIISPMMETAISAGLTAPMSRPIGPRIRAKAASPKPSARMRSARFVCVFREPSAPM